MNDESVIWKGRPSQLTKIWTYVLAGLLAVGAIVGGFFFPPAFAALVIPAVWAGWVWLSVRCRVFELSSQRLRLSEGVFNRRIDEIELYRVKDTVIEQPFWLRLFGLGNLILDTSDRSHPNVNLSAIHEVSDVREQVRKNVEIIRDKKRVREVDFESSGDDFDGDFDMN